MAHEIERQLKGLETPWSTVVERAGLFMWFGVSAQEWVLREATHGDFAGALELADFLVRPPATIERWPMADGKLTEIVQRDPLTGEEKRVPRWKLLYLVDALITDDPQGTGRFRQVAELAKRLGVLEQIEGWGFQTDLGGQAIGRIPEAELAKLPAAEQARMKAGILEFLREPIKRPGFGLALDSSPYKDASGNLTNIPKWGIELLRAAGTSHKEVGEAIKRLIWQMALVLGVEHKLVGFDGAGANSHQKQKSADFYNATLSALTKMAEEFRRVLVTLFQLNGWDPALVPTPTLDYLAFQDVAGVIDGIQKLSTEDPRMPHVQQLFKAMGLTPPPEDLLEELAEERRAEAEARFGLQQKQQRVAEEEAVDVDIDDEEDEE